MPEIFATKYNLKPSSKGVKIARFLENKSVGYSDFTITTSNIRKNILRKRTHKRKMAVIMNLPKEGVFVKRDMSQYVKKHDLEKAFIVSYVGRIDPVRELDVVVKAIKHIENKIPNISFIICGTGEKEYLHALKKLIRDLNLKKRIILMGHIPQENILNYIELSHVSVCPYRYFPTLRGILDGISSTKAFEYLLVPKPVIVADFAANKYVFGNLVLFYKSGDPRSMGEKIIEVYENQKRFDIMAHNAQEILFKRYNPKKNEEYLLRIYRSLL
jgi:glycosyltransferase involved in cell wall biosynthesis